MPLYFAWNNGGALFLPHPWLTFILDNFDRIWHNFWPILVPSPILSTPVQCLPSSNPSGTLHPHDQWKTWSLSISPVQSAWYICWSVAQPLIDSFRDIITAKTLTMKTLANQHDLSACISNPEFALYAFEMTLIIIVAGVFWSPMWRHTAQPQYKILEVLSFILPMNFWSTEAGPKFSQWSGSGLCMPVYL